MSREQPEPGTNKREESHACLMSSDLGPPSGLATLLSPLASRGEHVPAMQREERIIEGERGNP